jgi:DNA primase
MSNSLNPVLTSEYRKKLCELSHKVVFDEEDRTGLDYLIGRGVSEESINTFKIGYCPMGAGVPGFSGMMIVPYYDSYGDLVAVTARDVAKNSGPKWWHESFDKPNYLFGMNHAYKHIYERNSCIIVEGQMDMIALFQRGIKNVVAVCGTTFSMHQLWMVSRLCDDVFLMFDTDTNNAGQISTNRVLKELKFIETKDGSRFSAANIYNPKLPMDYDADEYIREFGKDAILELMVSCKLKDTVKYEEIEEMLNE